MEVPVNGLINFLSSNDDSLSVMRIQATRPHPPPKLPTSDKKGERNELLHFEQSPACHFKYIHNNVEWLFTYLGRDIRQTKLRHFPMYILLCSRCCLFLVSLMSFLRQNHDNCPLSTATMWWLPFSIPPRASSRFAA